MATYTYKARNNSGQLVEGDLTAISEQEVIAQLRQLKFTPVKISQGAQKQSKESAAGLLKTKAPKMKMGGKKIKVRDMTVFCTNLSSMSNAGIPLLSALNMSTEQVTNPYLAAVIRSVSQSVSDGSTFSDSLAQFPDVFSNFFVNMIRAAELSGTLDQVLKDMAIYLEKEDNMQSTVRGMMIYPGVLLGASAAVILLIITFVMPQFVTVFTKAGVPLPAPTRMLYELGLFVKRYPLFYFPIVFATVFGVKKYLKTENGKNSFDRFILKVPVIGSLINNTLVARFCRTLATMLNTGVPMLQGLKIVEQVLGNVVFGKIVQEVYDSVEKGEGIHKALMSRKEIPKDVTYMISVGEKSGNIGMMLNKVADFYESKIQFEVKELMVLIEPTFIAFIGICVGGILASIILPMFDMVKTISK
ncbi:MAG: type II secretion system F family protein [Candidatus Omnitrophica bacterium]|nr:type II secretion system F family protein [Candidatus Omnitrophota bacterium]